MPNWPLAWANLSRQLILAILLCCNFFTWGCGSGHPDVVEIRIQVDWDAFMRLHANATERGAKWEIPAEANVRAAGPLQNSTVGLRIQGWAARHYIKKSYRLYFRDKKLKTAGLFPGFEGNRPIKQLVLNGNATDYSGMRNWLAMRLTRDLGGLTSRTGFCRLWVNGIDFGLYGLVERPVSDFAVDLAGHANIDYLKGREGGSHFKNRAAIKKMKIETGDARALEALIDSLPKGGMKALSAQMDMGNLTAYLASCIYSGDRDWGDKNYYYLNDRNSGKARLIRWDADATFGRGWTGLLEDPGDDEIDRALNANALNAVAMRDPAFRKLLLKFMEDSFTGPLKSDRVIGLINEMEKKLEKAQLDNAKIWEKDLAASFARFDSKLGDFADHWTKFGDENLPPWKNDIQQLRDFVMTREEKLMARMRSWVEKP